MQIAARRFRVGEHVFDTKFLFGVAPCHLQYRLQLRVFGHAQPACLAEALLIRAQQLGQAAMLIEHGASEIDGARAGDADAQEDRQQFRIGERIGPACQQFFARSLVCRPVCNGHAMGSVVGPHAESDPVAPRNASTRYNARMSHLADQHILLGISGSIAAYKAALLTRRLVQAQAEVQVVMTAAAQRFITPTTLQALSGRAVRCSLWDDAAELGMGHIELARWADRIVIAPASADTLARLAHGRADDLLSTLCLASTAPVMVAPAMNHRMWVHAATQANVECLQARGVAFVGPASGDLAERESGPGRMAEPEQIEAMLAEYAAEQAGDAPSDEALAGRHVVVTAGPTRESLDPVRFLSNRSSGRMGYALATACVHAGARVTLVSGPTALTTPLGVERVDMESAADMHAAVMDAIDEADIFIGAAAVADYRPAEASDEKIKKSDDNKLLALTRTRDIIADVASRCPDVFTLGFAAETTDMENAARGKRQRKRLRMVAGNIVGPEHAFGREDNALFVCWDGGETRLPRASKAQLSKQLVALIVDQLDDA